MVQSKGIVPKTGTLKVNGDIPMDRTQGARKVGVTKTPKKLAVTSPHSGHFMSSNLEDDDEDELGVGPDIDINAGHGGFDFSNATKLPQDTYQFGQDRPNKQQLTQNFDNSLSKLFACMSIAYSGKLTTPKFKDFKGMRINVWDKMRLNNIIWREWYLQFVRKNKPLVCSFIVSIEDTLKAPQSVVLEGKYWKRKLDIVCAEYKKWRVYYKNVMMPKSKEKLGRDKHPSGEQISELLDRVADYSMPFYHQTQQPAADTLQLEDDLKMDFSDTIFSTLTQMPAQPSRMDYSNFTCSDFTLQPGLIGLQPTLDDFGTMETMEPFQDLLAEALGWNTSASYSPSAVFGGSLNNLSLQEAKQELDVPLSTFAQPQQQQQSLYNSVNTPQSQLYIPACVSSLQTQTNLVTHNNTILQPSNNLTVPQNYTMVQLSTVPSHTEQTMYIPTTNLDRSTSAPDGATWKTTSIITQVPHQQTQLQTQQQYTVTPQDEFVKPKASQKKPRTIAPKVTPQIQSQPVQFTSKAPAAGSSANSFLAQLLTKNQLPLAGNQANINTPIAVKPRNTAINQHPTFNVNNSPKTLVPALLGSSNSAAASSHQAAASKPLSSAVSPLEIKTSSPQSCEEFLLPNKLGDERREPSSAEQKRRTHIKNGFEALQTLVPSLANHPGNKVSKAAMLQKTADFVQKLKTERQSMQEEADLLQQEIDALNSAISSCQCQLPATGAPVTRQHNDQMRIMLNSYIKERTMQNWKFYIFSQMVTPLFDSFNSMVSTANIDELTRTTQTWLDQHCTLPALRPTVLESLRGICINTSILSEPGKFPDEARDAVSRAAFIPDKSKPKTAASLYTGNPSPNDSSSL